METPKQASKVRSASDKESLYSQDLILVTSGTDPSVKRTMSLPSPSSVTSVRTPRRAKASSSQTSPSSTLDFEYSMEDGSTKNLKQESLASVSSSKSAVERTISSGTEALMATTENLVDDLCIGIERELMTRHAGQDTSEAGLYGTALEDYKKAYNTKHKHSILLFYGEDDGDDATGTVSDGDTLTDYGTVNTSRYGSRISSKLSIGMEDELSSVALGRAADDNTSPPEVVVEIVDLCSDVSSQVSSKISDKMSITSASISEDDPSSAITGWGSSILTGTTADGSSALDTSVDIHDDEAENEIEVDWIEAPYDEGQASSEPSTKKGMMKELRRAIASAATKSSLLRRKTNKASVADPNSQNKASSSSDDSSLPVILEDGEQVIDVYQVRTASRISITTNKDAIAEEDALTTSQKNNSETPRDNAESIVSTASNDATDDRQDASNETSEKTQESDEGMEIVAEVRTDSVEMMPDETLPALGAGVSSPSVELVSGDAASDKKHHRNAILRQLRKSAASLRQLRKSAASSRSRYFKNRKKISVLLRLRNPSTNGVVTQTASAKARARKAMEEAVRHRKAAYMWSLSVVTEERKQDNKREASSLRTTREPVVRPSNVSMLVGVDSTSVHSLHDSLSTHNSESRKGDDASTKNRSFEVTNDNRVSVDDGSFESLGVKNAKELQSRQKWKRAAAMWRKSLCFKNSRKHNADKREMQF